MVGGRGLLIHWTVSPRKPDTSQFKRIKVCLTWLSFWRTESGLAIPQATQGLLSSLKVPNTPVSLNVCLGFLSQ